MNCYNYTKNKADCGDIETHMSQCSGLFKPPLASYVNIYDYAKKIRNNAVTIEAWMNDELIGMVACYLNNLNTFDGYITNVSVIQDHQGKGIASNLIKKIIEAAFLDNFKTLSLEVEVENKKAIDLYGKAGFVLNGRRGNKYLMINRLIESRDVLVSICCVTYNHEKYIRNAIEGFLTQKVDFLIEILIHDDASDDGTSDIIREYEKSYPEIIKPIYQTENQYSQGRMISPVYQFPRAKGKYIAICEGDDYWSDPYKLQKQIDFLESHPDYSLSVHNAKMLWETNKRKKKYFNDTTGKESYNINDLIQLKWFIPTASMVFRKSCLELPDWINHVQQGDLALALCLALKGDIHYTHEPMSIYRKNPTNLSATKSGVLSEFKKLDLFSYFDEYTNFIYHESVLKRKDVIRKNLYFQFLKNSGMIKKYLNIDYLLFKFRFLKKRILG